MHDGRDGAGERASDSWGNGTDSGRWDLRGGPHQANCTFSANFYGFGSVVGIGPAGVGKHSTDLEWGKNGTGNGCRPD